MCFLISAERTYQESCDDNLPCSRSLECKASGDKKTCQCKQNYKAIEGRCLKGKLNVSLLMYRFTPVLKILKSFDYDFVYIHLSLCICIKHKKIILFLRRISMGALCFSRNFFLNSCIISFCLLNNNDRSFLFFFFWCKKICKMALCNSSV